MAGFEVIIYGRFWVITEAAAPKNRPQTRGYSVKNGNLRLAAK